MIAFMPSCGGSRRGGGGRALKLISHTTICQSEINKSFGYSSEHRMTRKPIFLSLNLINLNYRFRCILFCAYTFLLHNVTDKNSCKRDYFFVPIS